jgi:hypothetical protein
MKSWRSSLTGESVAIRWSRLAPDTRRHGQALIQIDGSWEWMNPPVIFGHLHLLGLLADYLVCIKTYV